MPTNNKKSVSTPLHCRSWCERGAKTDPADLDPNYLDCVSCHAEQNGISRAQSKLEGGTAYVNASCCINCAKLLASARVSRVVMLIGDADTHRHPDRTIDFLEKSGIEVVIHNGESLHSPR